MEVRIRDLALLALITAPVEGDAVAAACFDMAVEAVVGDVQLPVREPLVEGGLGVVEDLRGPLGPVEKLRGLLGPEPLRVTLSLLVDRLVANEGLLAKVLRRRKLLDLE